MRGRYIITGFFLLIFLNSVIAEEFDFNDIKPYYDEAYGFLVECERYPSKIDCTQENIRNAWKTITGIFYTKSARFFNHGLYSKAKEYSLRCLNLSISNNFQDFEELCSNITRDVEFFEFTQFINESQCGGIYSGRVEWVFEDKSKEKTPWSVYLDLTDDFDRYSTIIDIGMCRIK
jgi:hypothetical protein